MSGSAASGSAGYKLSMRMILTVCIAVIAMATLLGGAFGGSGGAQAPVPGSVSELPDGQYPIEGLAGVKVVSTPLTIECSDSPSIVVGVRFTRLARRVRFARAQRLSVGGRVLDRGPKFRNSSRWQFARLRLPSCRTSYEVDYVFYRRGDPDGQRLGNFVCGYWARTASNAPSRPRSTRWRQ